MTERGADLNRFYFVGVGEELSGDDAKDAAKKEFDDRTDGYKKALEEVNNLNKQLESQALSADKKTQLAKDRDDKINNIKNMEREINEFRQTRENQLREQALRMREGIVKEITEIVNDKVKTMNLDLVFDKSGMSFNGVPLVMYSRDNYDFTNDVVAALNKPGRATTLNTEMPAASPVATTGARANPPVPAKAPPAASTTPKKP
jgi:Skp family chaperone for outer membrane proteins